MSVATTYADRNQTRYFDQNEVPDKELIEKCLLKTHEIVMSKQNLMPYQCHIFGPDDYDIKRRFYELASTVEYRDPEKRQFYRMERLEKHERFFDKQKRFPNGNSQLFAPWVLVFSPRKPKPNKLVQDYLEGQHEMNYEDIKNYDSGASKMEIGMFAALLGGVCVDEGLNVSYTGCINSRALVEEFTWCKSQPAVSVSIGYPHTELNERYLYNKVFFKNKGEDKPKPEEIFHWME